MARPCLGNRARELDDAALRCAVGRTVGESPVRLQRRDIEYAPPALRLHRRRQRLREEERRAEVGVKLQSP
ncbi:hypothetical protein D3C72_2360410 [compost metagenome]